MGTGCIRTYTRQDLEYCKLETFCVLANNNLVGTTYRVGLNDIYFDYGAQWRYTGVITYDDSYDRDDVLYSHQTLCPRDYEILVTSDSFNDILNMAAMYANHLINGSTLDFSEYRGVNMLRCNDCGWLGYFEELKRVEESRGEFWGAPAYETMYYCPCCGGEDIDDYKGEDEDEEDEDD